MVAVRLDDQNGLGVMSWGQRPGTARPRGRWGGREQPDARLAPASRGLALYESEDVTINADGAERPTGSNNLPLR